VNVFWCVG